MKKVAAFTVLEMIFALAISAIVISGAFTLYRMIFVQWGQYRKLTNEVFEAVNIERLLIDDAAACAYMYTTPSGFRFVWEGDKVVTYAIEDSALIRNGGRLDTFYMGRCTRKTFFNGVLVLDSALIDRADVCFIKGADSNGVYIQKQYAADQLFRLDHTYSY